MKIIKIKDQDSRSERLVKIEEMVLGTNLPDLLRVKAENLLSLPKHHIERDSKTGEITTINGVMELYSYCEFNRVMLIYSFKKLVMVRAILGYYDFEMEDFELEMVSINTFDKVTLRRMN